MEEEAIDLNEDIPIEYQSWHCGYIPTIDPQCENPILDHMIENKTTLSQILAIPRFVPNKARKKTTALYSHNKLITSESFAAEIKEKEDREVALQLALQEKKRQSKVSHTRRVIQEERERRKAD